MSEATGARRSGVRSRKDDVDASRMTLAEHLIELRKRLLWSAIAIGVMTIAAWLLWEPIYDFMKGPYCRLPEARRSTLTGKCELYNFNVLGQFAVRLKVAFIGGTMLAGPIWLYQMWAFVAPGLHRKERRWAFWFIAVSFVLFVAGIAFAYLTLDKGLGFLLNVGGSEVENLLDVQSYFGFITAMLLAFGVSFELPLILVLLNIAGIVTTARMRSSRRTVAFLIALFSAIITPSQDAWTFSAMAIPMYLFFEGAIVFGRLRDRAVRRREIDDPNSQLGLDETSVIDDRPSEIDTRPSSLDRLDDE